jgi:hypothetical protein
MIPYACPPCRTLLQCEEQAAGIKHARPKCGQRLQVPTPPPNKTVLAPLAQSAGPPYPQAIPVSAPPASGSPAPPLGGGAQRRHPRRVFQLGCTSVALVASLFCMLGGVAYLSSVGWSIPDGWPRGGGGGGNVGKGDLQVRILHATALMRVVVLGPHASLEPLLAHISQITLAFRHCICAKTLESPAYMFTGRG